MITIKTIGLLIGLLLLCIAIESCARKHECATAKGKRKKAYYYSVQFR